MEYAVSSPPIVKLNLPGDIEAVQTSQLNARSTGYVKQYFADIGDRVHANQLLALIDIPDVDQEAAQAQLESAKAAVAQAQAAVSQQVATLAAARASAAKAAADLSHYEHTAAQDKAQLDEAHANTQLALLTWQRWQSLVAGGAISQQEADQQHTSYTTNLANEQAVAAAYRAGLADIDSYQQSLVAAQDEVSAAQQNVQALQDAVGAAIANVTAAQTNLNRYNVLVSFREIRAPFDGVITARGAEAGALIGGAGGPTAATTVADPGAPTMGAGDAGGAIFAIARLDDLRIMANVPQTDAAGIRVGQLATVSVRELPGKKFQGTVTRTTASLDPSTRTLLVEVDLPNPQLTLLPGMYAEVQLRVPEPNPPVLVPAPALVIDSRGTRVEIVRDNALVFSPVTVGRDFGQSIEVTSGVNVGDPVVTNPTDDFRDGMAVTAVVLGGPSHAATGGASSPGAGASTTGSSGGPSPSSSPTPTPTSVYADALKQEGTQGNESNSAIAQPGGVQEALARAHRTPTPGATKWHIAPPIM